MIPILSLLLASAFGAAVETAAPADPRALAQSHRRPAVATPGGIAPHPDQVALGQQLFYDPRLSGSGVQSCASCHNPGLSFADGLPRAVGAGMHPLGRRTPTLLDVAWASSLFWDGRAATLEAQALGPIAAPGEMNLPLPELEARIRAIPGYVAGFGAAFPGEAVDAELVGRAIAAYERTITSGEAPFDRWVEGDEDALGAAEVRGFVLFDTTAGCGTCHTGWRFTDDGFYDVGIGGDDRGRAAVIPGVPEVDHAFKTPTLRDVARRYPYMHDGSAASLADVVAFYGRGGNVDRPSKHAAVRPLGLSRQDEADLVAFLGSLTGAPVATPTPTLPR